MMTSRCVHRRFPRHCVAAGPQQSRIFAARATIMRLCKSARSITVVGGEPRDIISFSLSFLSEIAMMSMRDRWP